MSIAYSDFVDFIIAGHSPAGVIAYQPAESAKQRVADLITKEKNSGLSIEEAAELDHFIEVEHIMRLAKARARQQLDRP